MFDDPKQQEIDTFIRNLNHAWLSGDIDALKPCFHPDAVLIIPGSSDRLEGRDAILATYRGFLAAATVHDFQITRHEIDIFESTATSALHFRTRYELDEAERQESGIDYMVLNRKPDGWQIVWRTQTRITDN